MATKKNPGEEFTGRSGNKVTYYLNGVLVERTIGVSTKPPTENQFRCRQATSLITELIKPVKEFLHVGFDIESRKLKKSAYSLASSYNRLYAVSGEYPDQEVAFDKVLFSKGNMPPVQNVTVNVTGTGLQFRWDTALNAPGQKPTDVVMLMAYDPVKKMAFFILSGPMRSVGTAQIRLTSKKRPMVLETYISFVAANRKSISSSQYTGQFLWRI